MSKFSKQILEREHPTRKKTWKILRVAQKESFLHSNPPSAETPQQMAQYHSLTDFSLPNWIFKQAIQWKTKGGAVHFRFSEKVGIS